MDNLKAALEAAAKSLMDHSLDHGDESFLHAASTALNEAAKVLEPTPIVYGRFPNPPSWEKGQWVGTDETFDGKPPKTEFFWPSMPDLPSMILHRNLGKHELDYIALDTAMAREHLLMEYAKAVRKVAGELVDARNEIAAEDFKKHEQEIVQMRAFWTEKNDGLTSEVRRLQADVPAYEQAAKQQGIIWCSICSATKTWEELNEDGESSPTA